MDKSMSQPLPAEVAPQDDSSLCVAQAAWHGLFWLSVANAIGVGLAALLLIPALNPILGEWTYGRWMMVHMNLELYGWTSMPLLGLLFRVYGADRGPAAPWRRPVLWLWSAALGAGALSWLAGHSSGKLFLDWSGFMRVFFPASLFALWLLLLAAFLAGRNSSENSSFWAKAGKLGGLVLLLAVPFAMYVAANPAVYPAINPDSGGPTGTSQLESSLVIVAILLVLPLGIARRKTAAAKAVAAAWMALAAESVLCASLSRADVSHRLPVQYLSLATLFVWLPLVPFYYSAFVWHANTRRWRLAFLWWWALLVVTGWIIFLPGVLDRFKFTDGLVGHSFIAMGGFTSSFLIFVVVQVLGEDGWIFNGTKSFFLWHASAFAYAALMTAAGWIEGADPGFTIIAGPLRNLIYILRLMAGLGMLLAGVDWLADATRLLRQPASPAMENLQEKTA